ncbi:hypothetical protein HHI36_002744 [Cryptolaemus montrouzieri]|uniref:TRPM SLOG domain-containing protein n=1 Tax=Cryptolaemus montrouzieri TaxID=559131 RepID=A0ABD2PBY6_9CUCU
MIEVSISERCDSEWLSEWYASWCLRNINQYSLYPKNFLRIRIFTVTQSPIPIVCLVIEGGTNTIRAVLEYVTDDPPVPVVVCDGSGRAADLISFVYRYELRVLKVLKDYIIGTIQRAFEVPLDLAEVLFGELLQCVQNKNLITIYRIAEKNDQTRHELDQTILTALFKSQHLSPTEQLSLALTWNRSDIARSEIFIYGQEWPQGALEDAMMKALEHDRCDFVKLLLENGVSMRKFLTIPRLENLYNSKQGPSNTLGYILRDVRPHIPVGYVYTLHDIGLVINKLMGGAYRAFYTRRKFRPIYAKVMNKGQNLQRNSSSFAKQYGNAMSLLAGALPSNANPCLFDYPFNELLTDKRMRKNNIIIHGPDTQQKYSETAATEVFQNSLNVEVEIGYSDSYRLGDGDTSPVLVELISYKKQREILKNSFKLKGTDVFVSSDLSPSERIKQKALVQQLTEAKQGEKYNKIRGTRIIIDGKSYTGEQMEVF